MIIIGITGTLCSGKTTAAEYLEFCLGFKVLNTNSEAWDKLGNHSSNKNSETDFSSAESYRKANAKLILTSAQENLSMNYVIYPITLPEELSVLRSGTNFMLIGIDASVQKRFENYQSKQLNQTRSLAEFIDLDDKVKVIQINYGLDGYPGHVYECMYSAEKILINPNTSKESFYNELQSLDILNPEHFRPSWDTYFMRIAEMAATRTNCMKRGVGAVVVHNNRLISAGYNGTPAGTLNCIDGGCPRCNLQAEQGTMLEDCMCMHGELNAILFAGYENCEGTTLYTTLFPCLLCSKSLIQAGVVRVVYEEEYNHSELSAQLLQQANVKVDRHSAIVPLPF